ncbi:MAG: HD domain-containing protein [Myxococcota bacterium]
MYDDIYDTLLSLMEPLARVRQDPRYHPEGDALYHSLQVFDRACAADEPPHMLAAALFHDIGKAIPDGAHEMLGVEVLAPIANDETLWLVGHHMDLLRDRRGTRQALRHDPVLDDLERLRAHDDAGRRRNIRVTPLERALGHLLEPGVAEHWLHPQHIPEA